MIKNYLLPFFRIPIKESSLDSILSNTGGNKLKSSDVEQQSEKAYLSGIAAFGLKARLATLSYAFYHGLKFKEIYSIPITNEGLNWIHKMGFKPKTKNCEGIKNLYVANTDQHLALHNHFHFLRHLYL